MHAFLAAASLISCEVRPGRWVQLHFAVRAAFSLGWWIHVVCQPVLLAPVWPACWLLCIDKSRESKSAERCKGFGRFMKIG